MDSANLDQNYSEKKNIPWRFQKVKLEFVAHPNDLQSLYIVRDYNNKVSKGDLKYTWACV